ncbi:LamG-like jellyroll fold domain-containing protein [Streptomyces thermolilacinus]|uniref:LamG-like jellyroll fold domain-containing protein n=1 Tax=Streptomyces thermolilacinus TaxID=285540 RepID=UPI0033C3CA6E
MTHLVVEVGWGATVSTPGASITWTDITRYVDVAESGVSITRGSSDEVADIQPSTCTLVLNNADGRFSPGLASSPYYPHVRKGTPIRVRVLTGGIVLHSRFYGTVNEWPTRWAGLYSKARITCTDILRTLGRLPELRSALDEEVLRLDPSVYYPMTEPSESATAGDLSGTGAGALSVQQVSTGGTLAFAAVAGPAATGESVVQMTPVATGQGKFLQANLGPQYESRSTTYYNHMECWFQTSTPGRVIFSLSSPEGQNVLLFSLSGTGTLQVETTNDGTALTPIAVTTGNLANGAWHHLAYDEYAKTVHVDGAAVTAGTIPTMWRLRTLRVGGHAGTRLWSGSIAHLALYTKGGGTAYGPTLATHYAAGTTGFSGEPASTRIGRLAAYADITSVTVEGATHDAVVGQGPGGDTALARMKEVEQTESGKLFAARDRFGLVYQSRDVRYNPAPSSEAFTVAYADTETPDVEIRDDDQKMVNTVIASRPGGATQRVLNAASRAAYGVYQRNLTLLKTSDGSVLDAAQWLVSRYADPLPELREVPIEAYTLPNYADILDADISSTFSVTGMPAQSYAATMRVTVEGYTETIKHNSHVIQFHTSRSDTDSVWVLGDSTYSVLGSTTRLAY